MPMIKPKFEKGDYRITRWCCTSGMCITCQAAGDRDKRKRIIHTDGVSEKWADYVVASWNKDSKWFEVKAEKQ
jgi:hypothetical protein